MTTTCTITTTATGGKCGDTAICTGTFGDGTAWGTCAAHTTAADRKAAAGRTAVGDVKVGDHVAIRRYGKVYDAVVTRVARTGRAYATFTYGNGATRTVAVDA